MPLRLIVFDLDDTLYLERDFVKSGFKAVGDYLHSLGTIDSDAFFKTAWALFEDGARGSIFNQALDILGNPVSNELIAELIAVYRQHQPAIIAFEDAGNLLQMLKRQKIILALISDGPVQTQKNKLGALGLTGFFEHIILTEYYGITWRKPSPTSFLAVMHSAQVEAHQCSYVADNPRKDFWAPNILGWHSVRLRDKQGLYYQETSPPGGEPQDTVGDFKTLCQLLLKNI
ncbi:MAG: HAD family hydrolase [Desulfobacca sp.]|nr:HAD family hydrolase [Desulfobacca sp.]